MKAKVFFKGVAIIALALAAFFLLFSVPSESEPAMAWLWTLVWTKTLGILLFGLFCVLVESQLSPKR